MNINRYGTNAYYGGDTVRYKEAAEKGRGNYISVQNLPDDLTDRPIKKLPEAPGSFLDELNKQAEEYMGIPIVRFEKDGFRKIEDVFTPTNHAETDRSIRAGLIYKKSCFDSSRAGDYDALTEQEDFSGMSDTEIYISVYEKYKHCYGEHFLDADAMNRAYCSTGLSDDPFAKVIFNFYNEIRDNCGKSFSFKELYDLRKNALYPGMTDDEIRREIVSGYKERLGDKVTNKDLCKMAEEMRICNVDCGLRDLFSDPDLGKDISGIASREAGFEKYLDSYSSRNVLDKAYELFRNDLRNGSSVNAKLGNVINLVKSELFPGITF